MTTSIIRGQGIFVDDGYPESDDYESNYVTYDPRDPRDYARAVEEALRRMSPAAGKWPPRSSATAAV
jgi:hypothetical protein